MMEWRELRNLERRLDAIEKRINAMECKMAQLLDAFNAEQQDLQTFITNNTAFLADVERLIADYKNLGGSAQDVATVTAGLLAQKATLDALTTAQTDAQTDVDTADPQQVQPATKPTT